MRFVILKHQGGEAEHYDLMLEGPQELITWSCSANPLTNSEVKFKRIVDHRKAYLDYEGPVSENRGTVHRVESGKYEPVEIGESQWVVKLAGKSASKQLKLPAR
ncbi:MAG: hypothetical protein KAR11_00950 [Phycisphaerae bacterium]|nr:hypothetical protein [Phycisphaerae bacterium]